MHDVHGRASLGRALPCPAPGADGRGRPAGGDEEGAQSGRGALALRRPPRVFAARAERCGARDVVRRDAAVHLRPRAAAAAAVRRAAAAAAARPAGHGAAERGAVRVPARARLLLHAAGPQRRAALLRLVRAGAAVLHVQQPARRAAAAAARGLEAVGDAGREVALLLALLWAAGATARAARRQPAAARARRLGAREARRLPAARRRHVGPRARRLLARLRGAARVARRAATRHHRGGPRPRADAAGATRSSSSPRSM